MKRREPPTPKWVKATFIAIGYIILICSFWLVVFYMKNSQSINLFLSSVTLNKKEISKLGPYSDALESNFIRNKKIVEVSSRKKQNTKL
jgi:hypothetical protein